MFGKKQQNTYRKQKKCAEQRKRFRLCTKQIFRTQELERKFTPCRRAHREGVNFESLTPTRGATQQSVEYEPLTPTRGALQQSVECESLTPTQGAMQPSVECESLTPTRGATQQSVDWIPNAMLPDEIRSGCLTPTLSGAQKRAELLRNPCFLADPKKRG